MRFTKMHALGNDFILLEEEIPHGFRAINFSQLSDRHKGIGFDQAIIVDPFQNNGSVDIFTIAFVNADGSHAGGCGNGTRAVAGYLHHKTGLFHFKLKILLPTQHTDTIIIDILDNGFVRVVMPNPRFLAPEIPLSTDLYSPQDITLPYFSQKGFCVNVGNPHIVFFVPDCTVINLAEIGPRIENDSLFPERINVEIVHIISESKVQMRVWERGVGITQACGTGACAVVIAAKMQNLLPKQGKTDVILDGGTLEIDYDARNNQLIMVGDYHFVYSGELL